MRKLLSLLLIVLFGSMLLSSCGDSKPKELKANLENGKVIYNKSCIACHMTGVAGAAALTNKARWDVIATKRHQKYFINSQLKAIRVNMA